MYEGAFAFLCAAPGALRVWGLAGESLAAARAMEAQLPWLWGWRPWNFKTECRPVCEHPGPAFCFKVPALLVALLKKKVDL